MREKNLKRAQGEAALLPVEEEDELQEEEKEEEESECETDSEDEMPSIAMIKPVFVPKAEKDTIAARERLEAEEQALEDLAKRKLEVRKIETKQIVVEEVRNMLLEEANIGDVERQDLLEPMVYFSVTSLLQLEKIGWTNRLSPNLCKSSTLIAVEELNGLTLSMRTQQIRVTCGLIMILYEKNTTRKWQAWMLLLQNHRVARR